MESGDQFVFGFWEIEGDAVGFGEGGDHEDAEAKNLRERSLKNCPARDEAEVESALAVDQLAEAERVKHQQRRGDRHGHRQLIADHLRGAAQSADQRILIVRGPAGEGDSVDADARESEDKQDADVEVGELHGGREGPDFHFGSERDDGDRDQREHHGDEGGEEVEEFVDVGWEHVLFGEELDHVGERLEESMGSDAAGSDAELDVGEDFSLDPLDVGERGEENEGYQGGFD